MFERTRAAVAGMLMGKSYDANWFLRFMRLADEEDAGSGAPRVRDPMKQNAWVSLAVNAIARNLSRAPFEVKKGDKEDAESEIARLFAHPNDYMQGFQLWQATEGWLKARGEAFWILDTGGPTGPLRERGRKLPSEIRVVDPAMITHVLDPDEKRITLYKYGSGTKAIPYQPEQIVRFYVWNKWNEWRGVNPLICMSEELAQDLGSNVSNTRLITSGAVPRGVLASKQRLTEVQAKELQDRWEKAHGGQSNAHKIAVLGSDTTYQQVGLTPADLEYFQMRKWNRQTILALYGVLPAVVGVKDDLSPLSGADTNEQMRSFWNITIIPDQRLLSDAVNEQVFRRFALDGYTGKFCNDDIQELKADEGKRSEIDRAEIAAGVITINEVRKARGEKKVPWGDVWWASVAVQPISDDQSDVAEPSPATPPAPGAEQPPALPPEEQPMPEEPMPPANETLHSAAVSLHPVKLIERKTIWPLAFRAAHWELYVRRTLPLETRMKQEIQAWFYAQRSAILAILARVGLSAQKTVVDEVDAATYWADQEQKLKKVALHNFEAAMQSESDQLNVLFHTMGVLPDGVEWSIWDTSAPSHLADRVNRGALGEITQTVRGHIRTTIEVGMREGQTEQQIADAIRSVYGAARGRAATIARTELGGIIGDSRFEGFKDVGFEAHSWLSAGDERVRTDPYNHTIDGEVRMLGDQFSNGLIYPNDPDGEAGNCINCRCVALPEPLRELSIVRVEHKVPEPLAIVEQHEDLNFARSFMAATNAQTAALVVITERLAKMESPAKEAVEAIREGLKEVGERLERAATRPSTRGPRERTITVLRDKDGKMIGAETREEDAE